MERTLKAVHGSLNVTVPHDMAAALGWKKGQRLTFQRRNGGLYIEASIENQKPIVVTIGYEGYSPETFVEALRKDQVEVLVDVRDLPLSRRKGFSKNSLRQNLVAHGIDYRHMKALGAPKNIRGPYKSGGSAATFRASYQAHLANQEEAMEALKWIASQKKAAIMCVEKGHLDCHRGLLAAALVADGFRIAHV